MSTLQSRSRGWGLQRILVASFLLATATTIAVGSWLTLGRINRYLQQAEQERVSRDMDLARAFYDLKGKDITSMAARLASRASIRAALPAAAEDGVNAVLLVDTELDNELANLPASSERFVVILDSTARAVVGRICCKDTRQRLAVPNADWSSLPIVIEALTKREQISGTEVMPGEQLRWAGLQEQARIPLLDTPKAAPLPFDPREGTAGLVVASAAPVLSAEGEAAGLVLVGHLFNNDFTLVDRIKEVAGVDTVTIFLGDQRVSTNVLDEAGQRAIGTRVSQEVFDTVLVGGKPFTGQAYVVKEDYITRYDPLLDHNGHVVGILYVGARQAAFQQLVDSFGRSVLLTAAATFLLSVLLAIPLSWAITRPLTSLAEATRQVAEGDWSVRVPTQGPQETSILADSFNTMVETLKGTRDQLVQKEKLASVGQLAAGVAHEINNPLGSVLLYADILRRETPADNMQQLEDLDMIVREATRCRVIVRDLLNFARQNEVLAQETDINALLHELVQETSRKETYQGVTIVQELDPGLPLIQADPLQLRQVFLNLMNNAAEAMPGQGQLTLRTRKGTLPEQITVEVEDTGVGISPENMKKLFTPFFTTKPIGKGTGLGLAIIYGIVKMHQGQITVRSEVGRGTTFSITLRVHLPGAEAQGQLG
ncbi:MAG TPA: cache domain-containing protein [Anaerolineae bacterium]|nr:cache domain-containing protein [Anaerolineae bacterium]